VSVKKASILSDQLQEKRNLQEQAVSGRCALVERKDADGRKVLKLEDFSVLK
jgi:hypothetical protein